MSSLSDSDIETLNSIGHDTIQTIVALMVEAILYTIYFVLVIIAGNILLRGRRSKMSIFTFSVVLLMLMLDTSLCIIDVNDAIREITLTLTSSSSLSLADRYTLVSNLPYPVENAIYSYMSNLGDVIIIWRTYAFWNQPHERWFLLIPAIFLLGSVVASGLITFCVVKFSQDPSLGDFVNPPFCKNVQLASYVTATATTLVATLMICYKTWQYRRTISSYLRASNPKTRAENIMTILIESGVIYFLFFLSAVIDDSGDVGQLESATPALSFSSTIWTYMTSHILGIYPVLIVILVNSQKSYIDTATATASGTLASRPSNYPSHGSSSTPYWGSTGSRSKTTISGKGGSRSHIVDVNLHELRNVHTGEISVDEIGVNSSDAEKAKEDKATPVAMV